MRNCMAQQYCIGSAPPPQYYTKHVKRLCTRAGVKYTHNTIAFYASLPTINNLFGTTQLYSVLYIYIYVTMLSRRLSHLPTYMCVVNLNEKCYCAVCVCVLYTVQRHNTHFIVLKYYIRLYIYI